MADLAIAFDTWLENAAQRRLRPELLTLLERSAAKRSLQILVERAIGSAKHPCLTH
jgi:hypothetical protein